MDFKKRKISYRKKLLTTPVLTFFTALGIFIILLTGIAQLMQGFGIGKVLFLLGSDLEQDAYGRTNILLLGTGRERHDGSDLTDTIMVANINEENKSVTLLSIPRDLYVENKKMGGMRINNIYFAAKKQLENSEIAIELLRKQTEEVLGMEIQYYIKMDFDGLIKVVDELGGVDMHIPYAIYDPLYPKGETGFYETFFISQGYQHLDGTTALKYARSRHTTSDFSRSERQQALLFAIKEKAEKVNILSNKTKLERIYEAITEKMESDLSFREIAKLAEIGSEMDQGKIKNYVIHDDPSKCGGFLYTPDRELYAGAFVFIPAGESFESIQKMANIVLANTESTETKIQILNGTGKPYLAAKTKAVLKRHCLEVVRFGNGKLLNNPTTTYYRKNNTPEINATISLLQGFIPGDVSDEVPLEYLTFPYQSDADVIIELGKDYLRYEMKDPFDYIVELKKPEEIIENEENSEESETKKEIKSE